MAEKLVELTTGQLIDKLYGSIADIIEKGQPDNVKVNYFLPGVPFGPELASFMRIGQQPKALENTDEEGATVFTANELGRAAVGFAAMVDGVPVLDDAVVSTLDDKGEAVEDIVDLSALVSSGRRISSIYESVLANCRVINNTMSDEDQEKLDKARALLYRENKPAESDAATDTDEAFADVLGDVDAVVDTSALLADGIDLGDVVVDPNEISEPTRIMQLYEALRTRYEMTEMEALDAISKINPNDPNGGRRAELWRKKVQQARARWEAQGKKSAVEAIIAKIETLSRQGMPKYLSDLKAKLRANKWSAALVANDLGLSMLAESAYYTALRPNGVLDAPGTKVSITNTQSDRSSSFSSRKKKGKFGLVIPSIPLIASGSASTKSVDRQSEFFSQQFEISFEITQGLIERPWLGLAFLECPAYTTVDPKTRKALDKVLEITELSDGKVPPESGMMRAIPSTVYFIKNLVLRSNAIKSWAKSSSKELKGKGGLRIMGLGVGGSGASKTTKFDWDRATTRGEILMPGTYMVAMASRYLRKAPSPDFESHPEADDWI